MIVEHSARKDGECEAGRLRAINPSTAETVAFARLTSWAVGGTGGGGSGVGSDLPVVVPLSLKLLFRV